MTETEFLKLEIALLRERVTYLENMVHRLIGDKFKDNDQERRQHEVT